MSDGEKLGLGVHNFDSSKWNALTLYENQNEKKSNWIESMTNNSSHSSPIYLLLATKIFSREQS